MGIPPELSEALGMIKPSSVPTPQSSEPLEPFRGAPSEAARKVLHERFGFTAFRPGQAEVVEALLVGESTAAVFPTGSGKSLCYQLPALLLEGVTLVVSPLLALMKDQVDALHRRGIPAARLDSSLSAEEYREVLAAARSGTLRLLYVAPERFSNERFRRSLSQIDVALFAVDEAHCVSEWGHNFRPDYLKLASFAREFKAQRILALTATATPRVLTDICQTFELSRAVRTPFHRPNLNLVTRHAIRAGRKLEQLQEALARPEDRPAVVYVTYQRSAVEVAEILAAGGLNARPYHAGLPDEVRAETQELFLQSDDEVVVATIAFGMGIDKPNIRSVIHLDPPKSLENYAQEIGRAGRDGGQAQCLLLYHGPDRIPLENFVYGDTPSPTAVDGLVRELFDGREELTLNLYGLSSAHDLRPLVLRTLLTYLELDGLLEARTPIYETYRFQPKAPSKTILAQYSGAERTFLTEILKRSQKKRIWFDIDLERTARELGRSRDEVAGALDRCAEDGWLELRASDLRYRYRVLAPPNSENELEHLIHSLYQRTLSRERGEIERLDQVVSFVFSKTCLAAQLSGHFGETLEEPCGTCSVCCGEGVEQRAAQSTNDQALEAEPPPLPPGITDPRLAARFLCGVGSPALTKARLTRHAAFGCWSRFPFTRVLERVTPLFTTSS